MTNLRLWSSSTRLGLAALSHLAAIVLPCAFVSPAYATFHEMRVEQLIGSVNGNPAVQAIQLQMRAVGQGFVSNASLWVSDATGTNRVLYVPSDLKSNFEKLY